MSRHTRLKFNKLENKIGLDETHILCKNKMFAIEKNTHGHIFAEFLTMPVRILIVA